MKGDLTEYSVYDEVLSVESVSESSVPACAHKVLRFYLRFVSMCCHNTRAADHNMFDFDDRYFILLLWSFEYLVRKSVFYSNSESE